MIEWITHESKAIKGFPMGDSAVRHFPVYLPPDYNPRRSAPYPLVFLLSGYGSYHAQALYPTSVFTFSLISQLDQAILSGELPPLILVFPDGSSKLGSSQYINSPALGNYLDYFCDELIAYLDERYHTYKQASCRAVLGHSSGGFGALVFGMLRPDAFGHIYSSAGDSFYELLYLPMITPTLNAIQEQGSIPALIQHFLNHPNPGGSGYFDAMMTLAMCPCYAPNLKADTLLGDLFFDLHTGALVEEAWERFLAWDPVRMVDHHSSALDKLNSIHLDCGLQDPYGMQWGHRQIAHKLHKAGIACTLNEYPGKHNGHSWRHLQRIQTLCTQMKV